MHILKKTLKVGGIIILLLIIAALLIPFMFKKQITELVKTEINSSLLAKVDFNNVSLSLFKHFPNVSITVDELSVISNNPGMFTNDTVAYAKQVDASADLISIIKGNDIKVKGVYLQSPRIHALVNKDGIANWDIVKQTDVIVEEDTMAQAFSMSLKKYSIHDGYIHYADESSGTYASFTGLTHSGSGDFTQDIFTLQTITNASAASITQDAIPYLANTKTDIKAAIKIDNATNTYSFDTDDILLNNLLLKAKGFFQLANDSTYNMDIQFESPSNDFKDILSLIPSMYKKDFDKLNASGGAAVNGFVKGTYSPQQLPAYDVKLEVRNGSFQYPDLPKPVTNIQLDLRAHNVDGRMDNTVIDISKGHLEMDKEPFDFRFIFKNPETSQFVDAAVKGKLNLSQLSQFIKLETGTKLSGFINADAYVRGNLSAIQNQTGDFAAGGFFNVRDLFFSSKDFPQPVSNGSMNVKIENTSGIPDKTNINISSGHVEIGKDPMDFSLVLSQPVTNMNFNGAVKGRLTLDHIKQFITLEPGTDLSGLLLADIQFTGNKEWIEKEQYDKIKLTGTADLANLKYVSKDYPGGITISKLFSHFTTTQINLAEFAGNYLGTNFSGNGNIQNAIGYSMDKQPLTGTLNVSADKMNLNDWMATEETATATNPENTNTPASSTPFLVPENLDIKLMAKAGQVTYDKVSYNNINGVLLLKDETVKLENVKLEALKGNIVLEGSYSTRYDKKNPDISMSYSIKDVDVHEAFLSYNTIQALMPVGRFLSGKLNSELTMTGAMGGNMMPDLNSLSGKGNLLLIEGVLKNFAPLEKLANMLQIDFLKSIAVKDIKNYIEFANGKVLVKPFTIKVQDIEMQIGGMHGFDQSLDYMIAMKVPRKYLGAAGNNLVNGLAQTAINKGIPVKLDEMVNLNVKMAGSIGNPQLKIDLEQAAGDAMEDLKVQAKDFAEEKMEVAKQRVTDSLTNIKNELKEDAKAKLKEQLFGKDSTSVSPSKDSTKNDAGTIVKEKLKDLFKKPGKKQTDSTGN